MWIGSLDGSGCASSTSGLTLLEVLVALTVLGLSLGLVLKIFSSGLTGATRSKRHNQAVLVAESQLARVGSEIPLRRGERSGQWQDNHRWRIRIREAEPQSNRGSSYQLYRVGVSVSWKAQSRRRTFRLQTLRLGGVEARME